MGHYSDLVIADGGAALVGYWPIDAEFGVTDKSPTQDNASSVDGPSVGGTALGALSGTLLNGTSQYFQVADVAALRPGSSSWTVEGWLRDDDPANQFRVIAQKRSLTSPFPQWSVFVASNASSGATGKQLCFQLRQDASNIRAGHSVPNIADQTRHHFMVVGDKPGNRLRMFIDGTEVTVTMDANAGAWPTISDTDPVTLGANSPAGGSFFLGVLAHPAVYAADMSAVAASHFTTGSTFFDSGAGTVSVSGSSSESRLGADSGSGSLAVAGSGLENLVLPTLSFEPPVDLVALDSDLLALAMPSAIDLARRDDLVALRAVG